MPLKISILIFWNLPLGTLLCPTTLLVRNKVHLHHIISRSLSKQATLFKWETSSMSSFVSFFQSKRKRLSNRQLQHEDSKDQPFSPSAPCHHQDETSIDNTSITSKSMRSLNNKNNKSGKTKLSEAASYYGNCLLFPNWSPFVTSLFLSGGQFKFMGWMLLWHNCLDNVITSIIIGPLGPSHT